MVNFVLNRYELEQYGLLRAQVIDLDDKIREVEDELAELNKYNINISPVYTGMPMGNEKRDKIAEFLIMLENDRRRLNDSFAHLTAERTAIMYRLYKIRAAVNKIQDSQVRDIIIWHYFDRLSLANVATKGFMTYNAVYKRLNKFLLELERVS